MNREPLPLPTYHPVQTLPELLDHVLYEMEMACWTYLQLNQPMAAGEISSVILEDYIVHLRCLNEFFREPTVMQRLKPWHFVAGYQPEKKPHDMITRMHSEVAHLTVDRKKPGTLYPEAYWNIADAARPIFVSCLPFLLAIQADAELMAFRVKDGRTNGQRTAALLFVIDRGLKHITPPVGSVNRASSAAFSDSVVMEQMTGTIPSLPHDPGLIL